MKQFETLNGVVAPLDRSNVDTDAIIPKQYLKSIKRSGFGPNLFDDWRYLDPGLQISIMIAAASIRILSSISRPMMKQRFCWLVIISAAVHHGNMRFGRWMILVSGLLLRQASPIFFTTTHSRMVCCQLP